MITINEIFESRIDTMTSDAQNTEMARSKFDYQAPLDPHMEYAERLQFTPIQAFKSSTHLCITIRWGVPSVGGRGPAKSRAGESC